jgi:hypothetical protein
VSLPPSHQEPASSPANASSALIPPPPSRVCSWSTAEVRGAVDCSAIVKKPKLSYAAHAGKVAAILLAFLCSPPAVSQSVLTVGPRNVQILVLQQLFNRTGRWYLVDDGDCYTYLESPRTHIALDRLVLRAHLSSKFGQQVGNGCVGAAIASNVTLSGKLHGSGHFLILDDIRVDRVDDESARSALDLALKIEPQLIPRTANIDVSEFVGKEALAAGGSSARLDEFRIVNITTRPDSIVIQFDLSMSLP